MPVETTEVRIVGAGQAGVALREHPGSAGIPHLVLERARIAAPIGCGVEVTRAERLPGRPGLRAETSPGVIAARCALAATRPFQRPLMPPMVPQSANLLQIQFTDCRNPSQLPDGAALVAGSGLSGTQIADETNPAGRQTFLSVAPDPAANIRRGVADHLAVLAEADAYTTRNGLGPASEPEARHLPPDPEWMTHPIPALNFAEAGIGMIIRATGHAQDFSWLALDAFDAKGQPPPPARRDGGARSLLSRPDLAGPARRGLYLGGLA